MFVKHTLRGAVVSSVLLAASVASHAYSVTLNPKGAPLNCAQPNTVAQFDCQKFQSDNVTGKLGSSLQITNYQDPTIPGPLASYGAGYVETGAVRIETFSNLGTTVKTPNAGLGFLIWAEFTLSGAGVWSKDIVGDTVFTAVTTNLSNSAIFGSIDGGSTKVKLADLSLVPGNLSASANLTAGSTDLYASFAVSPVGGSLGVGGFFEAPAIWNVQLFANNVGFGSGNGTVNPTNPADNTPVSFNTTGTDLSKPWLGGNGSFNGAFVNAVPEPGALALVGVALAGLGLFSRRKAVKA